MSVMRDVVTVFENIWNDFVKSVKQSFKKQKDDKSTKILVVVLLVAALGYGGFRVYKWRIAERESKASTMFSESMQLYMRAQEGEEQWDDVAGAFSLGYEKNSSSQIAPFFKLFQADAVLQQGQKEQARQLMDAGISELPKGSQLADLYKIKKALIDLDEEETKAEGIAALEKISEASCPGQSIASYYLGSYYWQQGETEKAQKLWESLPKAQGGDQAAGAPVRDMLANKIG